MLNRISTLALLGLFTFAAACGDDSSDNKNNTTNNTPNNTTNNSTNNTTNNTTNNSTNNGTTNNTTNTNNTATQCTAVGQTCVAGDATNAGFVCGDDGLGAKCLRACTPPADGEAYPCTSGQVCDTLEQGGATACVPSQCAGFQDAAGCDKYNYPTGGVCFGTENDNFICIPAGEKTLGVACETAVDCASGLLCFDGACKTVCAGDAACTETGERCIGDTDPDFLNAGAGVCELGCDSYSTGQCATGTGCFPFTETDGICVPDNGTGAPGATCTAATFDMAGNLVTPSSGCLGGLACINFGDGVATCVASCNGAAASQTAMDATCPTGNGTQFCFNLADAGEESANSGICLDQCAVSDYGNDRCTADGFNCSPFRGERHVCLPGGDLAVGTACTGGDCAEGSFCLLGGDNAGKCTAFCDLAAAPNALLACDGMANQTCDPLGNAAFAFGRCGYACDSPFADTDCPGNLQNCFVESSDLGGFCSASGAVAVGGNCGDPTSVVNSCLGGNVCANSFSITPFADASVFDSDGACTKACRLAGAADQCGAGMVCGADFLTFSTGTGICESLGTNMANTAAGAACPDAGKACGPNSMCVDQGDGTNACYRMCEVGHPMNRGCEVGTTCNDVFGGLPLGICR
jgi:hypothetical protein